jgi:hypothetical protein
MPVIIPIRTARRVTLDGVSAVVAVSLAIAYLIAPQFVAGLLWNAVNTAVNFWAGA